MHVQLSDKVRKFSKRLCLAGVLASDDAGSRQYADWTRETCQAIGVDFCLVCLSPRNVATYIKALNTNPCIDGIIVYYPIFGDSRDDDVKILVNHGKDVEALNCRPTLQFPEVTDECPHEATTRGGWEVCIINRSDVVGLPLARLLAGQGARVYSVDVAGVQLFQLQSSSCGVDEIQSLATEWTLQDAVKMSGVIISAVPHPAFKVDTEWLQSGAICINVSSFKNFKSDVLEIASKFMPRVGKLTIVALLSNLLLCADKH
ncbi:methylenetetrahydrofolate dehydrogenase [Penicillium atrosanguineum]|nr:methylenetetrahydrofolate dehydrogenase [Penicillium atrosanguineum]